MLQDVFVLGSHGEKPRGRFFWHSFFLPDPMFLVILPIWAAAVLIMVIAMWIGWTMLTTPAPEPLEDFDFDEEEVAEAKPEE